MHSISKEELAYTAGLVDGEGTITMGRTQSPYRHPVVTLASCTFELLEFLKERFGGCICTKNVTKEGHSPAWSWQLLNASAIQFLGLIRPYLREPDNIRRTELLITEYGKLTLRNGKYTEAQKTTKLEFEARFFSVQRECQRRRTK